MTANTFSNQFKRASMLKKDMTQPLTLVSSHLRQSVVSGKLPQNIRVIPTRKQMQANSVA